MHIEEFLNSYTKGDFQGITLDSHFPTSQHFENYVPQEFEQFMEENVQEWVNLGVLKKWDEVKTPEDPNIPLVVSPLGVEPKKPRGLWDGRYVNEFCRDSPFNMDNAAKVAEVAWVNAYLFKLDHKNGYFHVPFMKTPGNTLVFFGKEYTMSLRSSLSVGSQVLSFTIQSLRQ